MYSCDELFIHSHECYFGAYFPCCCATREINTKITLSWAHKQFATWVHTLFSIYRIYVLGVNCAVNSLWLSDAKWHQRSWPTLVQAMACCLMAKAISWANADFLLVRFYEIHLRATLHRVPMLLLCIINLKIILLTAPPSWGQWVKLVDCTVPSQSPKYLLHSPVPVRSPHWCILWIPSLI